MANDAYEIAKSGGAHRGLISRYDGEADGVVAKALKSIERRAAEHAEKISDPWRFVAVGTSEIDVSYLVNSYWPKELETFKQESDVLRAILKERKHG